MSYRPHTVFAMAAPIDYVMKLSGNGQVSIPAAVRARWRADHLVVVDLGDRLVIRPAADQPAAALRGKYRDRGPRTDDARSEARAEDAAARGRRGDR